MKTILLTLALIAMMAMVANAQCPNCTPRQQQPPVMQRQPVPTYAWVRQRRGLFGWHARWIAIPTTVQPQRQVVYPAIIIR